MKRLKFFIVCVVMLVVVGALSWGMLYLSSWLEVMSAPPWARLIVVAILVPFAAVAYLFSLRVVSGVIFGIGPGEVGKWFIRFVRPFASAFRRRSP